MEQKLDCCGSGINATNDVVKTPSHEDHEFSIKNHVFDDAKKYPLCYSNSTNATDIPQNCHTCFVHVQPKMTKAFRGAGGLGLFFSFPEVNNKYSNLISLTFEFKIMTC